MSLLVFFLIVLGWYFIPVSWLSDYGPGSIFFILCPTGTVNNIWSIYLFMCRFCKLPLQFCGIFGDLFNLSSDLDAELAAALSDLKSVQPYEPDWLGFSSFAFPSSPRHCFTHRPAPSALPVGSRSMAQMAFLQVGSDLLVGDVNVIPNMFKLL